MATITAAIDDQLMIMAAHRYSLPRQTYMAGACVDFLRKHWDQLVPNTRNSILRDTIEALIDGHAGSPTIDAPAWAELVRWGMERLDAEQDAWLRHAVAWKLSPTGQCLEEVIKP